MATSLVRVNDRIAAPNPSWDSANPDPGTTKAPYKIYNIGNHNPVELMHLIETLETCLGKKVEKRMLPCPDTNLFVGYVPGFPGAHSQRGIAATKVSE